MNLKEVQQQIYQNKVDKRWNISSVETELCLMHGEIAEFYEAYRKHLPSIRQQEELSKWKRIILQRNMAGIGCL